MKSMVALVSMFIVMVMISGCRGCKVDIAPDQDHRRHDQTVIEGKCCGCGCGQCGCQCERCPNRK